VKPLGAGWNLGSGCRNAELECHDANMGSHRDFGESATRQ
jgi:hypothetical protein